MGKGLKASDFKHKSWKDKVMFSEPYVMVCLDGEIPGAAGKKSPPITHTQQHVSHQPTASRLAQSMAANETAAVSHPVPVSVQLKMQVLGGRWATYPDTVRHPAAKVTKTEEICTKIVEGKDIGH